MVRLKRFKIHHHPLVVPGLELRFGDRFNLLLGRNGTGKTTLLRWIDMALRFNFSDLEDQDFHFEYDLETETYGLRVEVAHGTQEVDAGGTMTFLGIEENRETRWHYRLRWKDATSPFPHLEVTCENGRTLVTVEETEESGKDVTWRLEDQHALRRSPKADLEDVFEYTQPHQGLRDSRFLSRVCNAITQARGRADSVPLVSPENPKLSLRFSEALQWWQDFLTSARPVVRYQKYSMPEGAWPEVSVEIPSGATVAFALKLLDDGVGVRSVGRPLAILFPEFEAEEWRDGKTELSFGHIGIGVLERAVEALALASVKFSLRLSAGDRKPQIVTNEYDEPSFFVTRKDGTGFSFDGLSFGQQRLFAFLCYLEVWPQGPVLADELPNGLHHGMIDYCLDAIGDRQAYLATQNPLLVDHIGFESAREVRDSFLLCDTKEEDGRELWDWHPMSDDEAEAFFKDYQVGIQHVNEILRMRGLW